MPRLPGTPALGTIEQVIAERLRALGYAVELTRFSAAPRRVMASVVAGAGLGWTALMLTPLLLIATAGWPVTLVGVGALGVVALTSYGVARGHLPSAAADVESTNLVARRGSPALWLVAHLDSKSQRISLRGRIVAAVCAVLGLGVLLVLLVLRLAGPLPPWAVLAAVVPALAGGGMLSLGKPGNRSPGAVDNASGVIAVLTAAELLAARDDVGVLLTGAEEFGMEGARAWATHAPPPAAFVNFDGIDSRGRYRVQLHPPARRRPESPSLSVEAVAGAVAAGLRDRGHDPVVRPLPVGTFVDGAVLAAAGMPGVTLSRGDWETLGVVHTPRDVAARVDVTAAEEAGAAAARAVRTLLG